MKRHYYYQPKRRHTGPRKKGELPSEAEVRAAVNAACAITGASVGDVLFGTVSNNPRSEASMKISRARQYAAFALRALFEDGNLIKIATMVGCQKWPNQFFSARDTALKEGRSQWWSDDHFMRVLEAAEAFIAMNKGKTGLRDFVDGLIAEKECAQCRSES